MKKTNNRSTYYIFYNVKTYDLRSFLNWSRRQIRKQLVKSGNPRDWKDVTKEYVRLYESCEATESEPSGGETA